MEVNGDRLNEMYPRVDEVDTPLPRGWSPKDKFAYLGLTHNNLRVHYKGCHSSVNASMHFNIFQVVGRIIKTRHQLELFIVFQTLVEFIILKFN